MKYIISENKLDKIINRYIDYSLSDINPVKKDVIDDAFIGYKKGTFDRTFFEKDNGKLVLVIIENKEVSTFYVDVKIIKPFTNMFKKQSFEIVDYVKLWSENTFGYRPDFVFPLNEDDLRVLGDY